MKLVLALFCAISLNSLSQNDWTKDDRNNLYDEYLTVLTKYKSITKEQKESIALCCLEQTTTKYTKKDFSTKIEIEIKRIHESIVGQCAKNIGVELDQSIAEESNSNISSSIEWTKEDKEKLAKEFEKYIEKYDNITDAQSETLSICYIQQTISTITKNQYNEMIEIEHSQHREKTITACAKSKKIDLNNLTKETNKGIVTKTQIIATWKTDQNFSITFNENGTFIKTFKEGLITNRYTSIEDNTVNGEWFLDEKGVLTLKESWVEIEAKLLKTNRYQYNETSKYTFVSFSQDYFKIEMTEGKSCCQSYNSSTNSSSLQANKVK